MAGAEIAGILYHGLLEEAEALARSLISRYAGDREWWARPVVEDVSELVASSKGADLIITIGGDGTILRGVHAAAPRDIPVLGINLGRVGFMSEIDASEAEESLGWYLENWDSDGAGPRVESRSMLQAEIQGGAEGPFHALNDVVVGRGSEIRVVDLRTLVDEQHIVTYRGDGLVVSTPTGSTGYSLALGGPVMHPAASAFLLKPIAAHMSLQGGLLLLPDSLVNVTVESERNCTLSVDGFVDRNLREGDSVMISVSPYQARFLRRDTAGAFYRSLTSRLGMRQGAMPRPKRRRRRNG